MIRWGVIGAGGIAYRRTIPEGIVRARNAKLEAVQDLYYETAKKIGSEFNARVYETENELLQDKNIDAVYIATPAYLHHEQCITAAKQRKHVLCEKNLALDTEQCTDIIDHCRKNGVKLGVGYMMRFNQLHMAIKKAINENLLGTLVMGRAQLSCWYPRIEGAWRQNKKLGGGGSLADMGSHCIDLLEFLFSSKTVEVFCITQNLVQDYEVEDTSIVICKFDNGAAAVIDNCFNIPDDSSKNFLEVYGSSGSILCRKTIGQDSDGEAEIFIESGNKEYNAVQKRESSKKGRKIAVDYTNIYKSEIEYFSDCIEKNIEPEISGELGLHHVKIIQACYDSAISKKTIAVS